MPEPFGWDHFPAPTSPVGRFVRRTTEQFSLWTQKLRETSFVFDERDSILYWNMLSSIYALTTFEHMNVRATIAHELCGAGRKTGQRKFSELKRAGLIWTKENDKNNKEKFVFVSEKAGEAVIATFDEWTRHYDSVTREYKKFRKEKGVILDG